MIDDNDFNSAVARIDELRAEAQAEQLRKEEQA